MARMHTGKHGKSKSRKPDVAMGTMPEGATVSETEVRKLLDEYSKQGMHQAAMGRELKGKGVLYFKQMFGKRLGTVLKEEKLQKVYPQDLLDLMKRAITIRKHLVKNHKDQHNKQSLIRTESKIWRLSKYYKREGTLPKDWKYEPDKVALIIKGS